MLHQFDYIFAIGVIFAFLDAWNIGANDVANSFATSVASKSLTYIQAMGLAAICEFLGAVLAGSRTSDTIRSKIIDVAVFEKEPAVLMLVMACALVGSSTWLTLATKFGAPVSTTHSIVGAIIGAGIAAKGAKNIVWGWAGFSQIVASWFISPLVAGGFASIIFLFSKYVVLERKHSLRNAFFIIPFFFFITFSILTMLIVWKGSPNLHLNKLSTGAIIGSIFGVGGVSVVIYFVFLYPFLHRKLVEGDWTLKFYHVICGPLLWWRGEVPPMPAGHGDVVIDYYAGKRGDEEDFETEEELIKEGIKKSPSGDIETSVLEHPSKLEELEESGEVKFFNSRWEPLPIKESVVSLAKSPKKWHILIFKCLTNGFSQDVLGMQNQDGRLAADVKDMHSRAKKYDNKVEHLFSFLQAVTAGTNSFAHGSNDISNACGPLATIYLVWSTNTIGKKAEVPIWILCYAGAALCIGLWTYGYNLMSNLGNKMTLQSPSRGFSCELGSAITVMMASRLGLPVSTTQCIVGAIVFVGLCNKDVKAVNWRMVSWCYISWILTLPCAGIISGIIMGIIINAPRLGVSYVMT